MPKTPQAATQGTAQEVPTHLSQRAYERLREMAINYRFRPGERLNEGVLAKDLQISRTPLREAMHRLVSEGLLQLISGRGFFARPLDVKEVCDLYEARLALETAIVRLACERAAPEWLATMNGYLDRSVSAHESEPLERLLELDEGFHERIADCTGNLELLRMLRSINARIHFFRWIDMQGRRDNTQAEHRALIAAIGKGDAGTAVEIAHAHVARRQDQIIDGIREGYARLYMGEGPQAAGPVSYTPSPEDQ
ncbi:GntR family transcriptional regulator [Algihabitans albus]|uniref:GntR family transcriptional regulator n=1 Tax=Algihabitans albus TaxID=2164067 RepID=UPI000E5CB987|nr:GntR family transcriptional regulator [Algihabitans albus]